MTPDGARAWLRVAREFAGFAVGLALGIWGVVDGNATVAVAGFLMAGLSVAPPDSAIGRLLDAFCRRRQRRQDERERERRRLTRSGEREP